MARYHRILALSANDDCYDDDCAANPPPPSQFGESQGRRLTYFIIIAAATFAASILLTLIYYAVLRRRRRLPAVASALPLVQDDASSLDDGEPLHPIWYIRTVGLDESTIASIAAAAYRAGDGLLDGVYDCSVCLAQFLDGERVRLLPKCGHAFHAPCIDTWLRAHINCPLCRAHIVDPEAEPALPEVTDAGLGTNAAGESVDMDLYASAAEEATLIGIRPLEEAEQNRGPESTTETGMHINSSQVFVSLPNNPFSGEQSDMNGRGQHPVLRSLSMDTPLTNATIVRAAAGESVIVKDENDAIFEQESILKNKRKLGSSSKGVLDPKAHPNVGRSFSISGRGFIFSRQGRVARMHSMPK